MCGRWEPGRAYEAIIQSLKQALELIDVSEIEYFALAGHEVVNFADR